MLYQQHSISIIGLRGRYHKLISPQSNTSPAKQLTHPNRQPIQHQYNNNTGNQPAIAQADLILLRIPRR